MGCRDEEEDGRATLSISHEVLLRQIKLGGLYIQFLKLHVLVPAASRYKSAGGWQLGCSLLNNRFAT